MGVPGLGMALGGLIMVLEPAIPKIKEFFDAWEMGVKPIDDVTQALETYDRAASHGPTRKKRALSKLGREDHGLQDKEDEQGFLAPDEQAATPRHGGEIIRRAPGPRHGSRG